MGDLLKTFGKTMAPQAGQSPGYWTDVGGWGGTPPIVAQPPRPQYPPGAIVEFPEQGGWHPPMSLPETSPPEQAGAAGGGGFFDTVGKIAGNPLVLAALKGYAGALNAPRGSGPITRIAGGVASGLEDYFVGDPYRRTMTEKAKAETEKEKALTEEAKTKAGVLKGLSPKDQSVALYPGLAAAQERQKKSADQLAKNQALSREWAAQAATTEGPQSAAMLEVSKILAEAGDANIGDMTAVAKAARAGKLDDLKAWSMKARVDLAQQSQQTNKARLGLEQQSKDLAERKETREAGQAAKTAEQADTRIEQAGRRDVRAADKSAVDTAHKQFQDQGAWGRNAPVWAGGGKSEQELEAAARQRQGTPATQPGQAPSPGSGQPLFTIKMLPNGRAQFPDGITRDRTQAAQFFQQHGIDPATVHQE